MNIEKLKDYIDELGLYNEFKELLDLDEEYKGDKKEEEKPKVCEFSGCKIVVYPDGNYSCSFDKLSDLLEKTVYCDFDDIWFNKVCRKRFKIKESSLTGYSYIDDIDLIKKINGLVSKEIKKRVTKKTIFKANILGELAKKGYEVETDIIDYKVVDSKLGYDKTDYDLLKPYQDVLDEWLKDKIDSEEFDLVLTYVVYYDENDGLELENSLLIEHCADIFDELDEILKNSELLIEIIENVFGEDSKEYNELMNIFNRYDKETVLERRKKYVYEECYLHGENNPLVETLPYMVMGSIKLGEKKYFEYINQKINVTMSLKEAYNLFPNYIKTKIAEDVFDGFDTKLLNDIVDIMTKKCKNKNNESYSRKEIINFLTDVSMQNAIVLMPEDILEVETEEYGGKSRK